MNTFSKLSRLFFVVTIISMSNMYALDLKIVGEAVNAGMNNPVVKVAGGTALAAICINGGWVIEEIQDNEPLQEGLVAIFVGGAVTFMTDSIFAGTVAGTTTLANGKILNMTRGTSVSKSVNNVLGDTLTSRPAQIVGLATVSALAGYAIARK